MEIKIKIEQVAMIVFKKEIEINNLRQENERLKIQLQKLDAQTKDKEKGQADKNI
jgi:hypothetical protein